MINSDSNNIYNVFKNCVLLLYFFKNAVPLNSVTRINGVLQYIKMYYILFFINLNISQYYIFSCIFD